MTDKTDLTEATTYPYEMAVASTEAFYEALSLAQKGETVDVLRMPSGRFVAVPAYLQCCEESETVRKPGECRILGNENLPKLKLVSNT